MVYPNKQIVVCFGFDVECSFQCETNIFNMYCWFYIYNFIKQDHKNKASFFILTRLYPNLCIESDLD